VKAFNAIEMLIRASLLMKGLEDVIRTHGEKIQKFEERLILKPP